MNAKLQIFFAEMIIFVTGKLIQFADWLNDESGEDLELEEFDGNEEEEWERVFLQDDSFSSTESLDNLEKSLNESFSDEDAIFQNDNVSFSSDAERKLSEVDHRFQNFSTDPEKDENEMWGENESLNKSIEKNVLGIWRDKYPDNFPDDSHVFSSDKGFSPIGGV